ncbi:polysaccharide deacetylase family protein [Streptomyces sp. NPDC058001]|uniref:polysaccharide deacetylase family protein n=1 Tax=Streptomyces sp. NPDC058001 TaxID=3346300 RepID=UPI0036EC8B91
MTRRAQLRRSLAGVLVAGVLAPALLGGCAQSVDPIERLSRKAAQKVGPHAKRPSAETYRRWGLPGPLAPAPSPPARPPGAGAPGAKRAGGKGTGAAGAGGAGDAAALPPVVDRVRTTDKVVFLTFDDGAEKEPRFVDMVRELRLPVSLFLTESVVGPGYAQFARLRAVGATVQNHTLHHPYLPGMPYAGQRAEICGQRDKVLARFGVRPRLFRPPHNAYDGETVRAAASCGASAIVLWRTPTPGTPLHRGDILLSHANTTPALLRRIHADGLTVARLEDYL